MFHNYPLLLPLWYTVPETHLKRLGPFSNFTLYIFLRDALIYPPSSPSPNEALATKFHLPKKDWVSALRSISLKFQT